MSTYHTRLVARQSRTVDAIHGAMVSDVRAYARLSSAKTNLLLANVKETWDVVLKRSAAGEPMTADDLAVFEAIAYRNGMDQFPLDEYRSGHEIAYVAGLRDCLSIADAGDYREVAAFIEWGAGQQARVLQAVTTAYLAARRDLDDPEPARNLFVDGLLTGNADGAAAQIAGIELPVGYFVVLCRLLAGRNSLIWQAITTVLESTPGNLWRTCRDDGETLILLPTDGRPDEARSVAANILNDISRVTQLPVRGTAAHATRISDIPRAVRDARQAMTIVIAMPDATVHPYEMDELLVELAVARQPALKSRLVDVLAPLQDGKDLLRTLEVLFDCGLDRERTTRMLHIHRRTLGYRLRRIRDLTGIQPNTAHGIQLLRSALVATRLPDIPDTDPTGLS